MAGVGWLLDDAGLLIFGRIIRRWLTVTSSRGGDNRQKALFRRGRRSPLGCVQNTPFSASGQERNPAFLDQGGGNMSSSRGRSSGYDCIVKVKGVTTRPILFSQLMRSDGEGGDKSQGAVRRRPQPRLRAGARSRGRAALAHAQHTGLSDIVSERV